MGQRGAAFVTLLLFITLILILLSVMLRATGQEIVISGLQRDSIQALEFAQAGLTEAVRRMEAGRPYAPGFTSSLSPKAVVTVTRRYVGTGSAYQEICSEAAVGRSTRRLCLLVLEWMISLPPNITFAESVAAEGGAVISCGDAYTRTYVQYKDLPSNTCPDGSRPKTITYAGWRISKIGSGAVGPCYTNAQCAGLGQALWYPAQRRAEPETSELGRDIKAQTYNCLEGGGGSPPLSTVAGVLAADPCNPSCKTATVNEYGFDIDDPDGPGGVPPQAVVPEKTPCGLPYKMVPQIFPDERGHTVTRLFKTIVFEQWLDTYWTFDEAAMALEKTPVLLTHPQFGAVPAFVDFGSTVGNYDLRFTGGGVISSGDFGCKWPEMRGDVFSCSAAPANTNRPVTVWLENGDYTVNGFLRGHGTIVVDGNLTVNGGFEYWGTLIVKGVLTLGTGNVKIHGGLVAASTLRINGDIEVIGGGTVTSVPVGRSVVLERGWRER